MVVSTTAGLSNKVEALKMEELIKPKEFSKLFGPYARSKQALNVLTAGLAGVGGGQDHNSHISTQGQQKPASQKAQGLHFGCGMFVFALPGPAKSARKIVDAAFSTRWGSQNGIFISGHKILTLPTTLREPGFQKDFLQQCRKRAAQS